VARVISVIDDGMGDPLRRYLQDGRDSVMRALTGLSEYDARRPLTSTGTNILGLVKHLVGIERSYLGVCVGRPPAFTLPWEEDGSIWQGADMWVREDESCDFIVGLYQQVWQNSDASIDALPLDTAAFVHWWKEGTRCPSFGSLIVRVVAETASMPATRKSCGSRSTGKAVWTPIRWVTTPHGLHTSRTSSRLQTRSERGPDRIAGPPRYQLTSIPMGDR